MELNKTPIKKWLVNQNGATVRRGREIVPRATLQYKLKEIMFDLVDLIESLDEKRNFPSFC